MPRRPARQQLPTTTPLTQLHALAEQLWPDLHLTDDLDRDAVAHHPKALLAAAHRLGHRTVHDMLNDSRALLSDVSGQRILSQYSSLAQRALTNDFRDTMASLIATLALHTHTSAKDALAALPKLPAPRKCLGPLRDDAILTLRITALYRATVLGDVQVAAQYALVEAGARPAETTLITPGHFDHDRTPTRVLVPRLATQKRPRRLDLPKWSQPLVATALDTHLATRPDAASGLLLYHGSRAAGKYEASATASGNIANLLTRAGYDLPIKPPTSVVRWRVAKTLDANGIMAAAHVCDAVTARAVYDFIDRDQREQPVDVFDEPATYIGQVPQSA